MWMDCDEYDAFDDIHVSSIVAHLMGMSMYGSVVLSQCVTMVCETIQSGVDAGVIPMAVLKYLPQKSHYVSTAFLMIKNTFFNRELMTFWLRMFLQEREIACLSYTQDELAWSVVLGRQNLSVLRMKPLSDMNETVLCPWKMYRGANFLHALASGRFLTGSPGACHSAPPSLYNARKRFITWAYVNASAA